MDIRHEQDILRRNAELEKELAAKNRELEIEAALEKVRARAMAMNHSDELSEVLSILFDQFDILGICPSHATISLIDVEKNSFTFRMTGKAGKRVMAEQVVSLDALNMWNDQLKNFGSVQVYCNEYPKEVLPKLWELVGDVIAAIPEDARPYPEDFPDGMYEAVGIYRLNGDVTYGTLSFCHNRKATDEEKDIVGRFATEFGRLYQRFLDLQKAEAQAREAEIQLALERVRARSLAMHHTSELQEVVNIVAQQLHHINIDINGGVFITINDEVDEDLPLWASAGAADYVQKAVVPFLNKPFFIRLREAIKKRNNFYIEQCSREEKIQLFEHLFKYAPWNAASPQRKKELLSREGGLSRSVAISLHTSIAITDHYGKKFSDEDNDILRRFGNVFEQSYTRFLDLQKAEAQAKEARIETALERIRARALAMHSSHELMEVAKVLREQLSLLGQPDLETSVVHLYEEDPDHILSWRAFRSGTDTGSEITYGYIAIPKNSCEFVQEWLTNYYSNSIEYTIEISGAKQKEWYDVLFKLAPDVINAMRQNKSIHEKRYHQFSKFSGGALLMVSRQQPSEESIYLQRRAAFVFDLAYRRFLDLKKAEAQARESQIQLALERVRARTMAMQRSDELMETAAVLFNQLNQLGENIERTIIGVMNEEERVVDVWATRPDGSQMDKMQKFPIDEPILMQKVYGAWRQQKKSIVIDLRGEELESYFQFLQGRSSKLKRENFGERRVENFAFFSKGFLGVINADPKTPGNVGLYERFADVFDQTYTRFLDLQKAEAQAREAKIETALEKVRSRTMAMQKSDELPETSYLLFQQLKELGETAAQLSIGIIKEEEGFVQLSATIHGSQLLQTYNVPMDEQFVMKKALKAWKAQERSLVVELKGKELKNYNNWRNSFLGKKIVFPEEQWIVNIIYFSKGFLSFSSDKQLPEETIQLLERFAGVFDQTYTRFLDLQKAEAQARDAQIEASLERVRSKTMAMHNSQDVGDTVATMFDELVKLGIQTLRCGVGILHEGYQMELWTAKPNETGKIELFVGHLDMKLHPLLTGGYESWKDKRDSYSYELKDDDLIAYFNVINNYSGYQAKYDIASLPSRIFHDEFNFNEGCLFSFSLDQLSAESSQIFKRFAGVFGQTYRRYLDLLKAEAQAKEAKIEASLERVRSKTMAMHNSQDVGDTVATMLDELVKLGVETVRCGIAIIDESKTMEVWTASSKEDGSVKLIIGQLDMSIHPLFRMVYDAWKNKVPVTTYELVGEDLKDYFRAVNNSPDYPIRYDIESLPYKQSNTAFIFPEGSLFVFSQAPLTTETTQIFKRFAGVFGQTYRRYLDLQKAEAQAREAKIEASLERVRAKAMAMHKSDDLHGAVTIMFEEFQKLNLDVLRCGIGILNKDSRTGTAWTTSVSDNGLAVQVSANESFDTHPLMMLIYEHWQKQEDLDYVLQGQDLISYYRAMDASELKLPKSQLIFSDDELQPQYYYAAMFNAGGLYSFRDKPFAAEDKNLMKRFASVVNLTYNRFLDLQKAEAQAREAKIEASLERVRAKAMAMHKSEDLNSAVATVFDELDKLDLGVLRCGISILDKEKRTGDIWVTSITDQGSAVQVSGDESFDIHPLLQGAFEAWLKKEDFSYLLKGDDLTQYYKAVQAENFQLPDSQILSSEADPIAIGFKQQYCFATPYGAGGLFAFRETEFPVEAKTVMKRFASVFDLTYKRFLDLQKAEASAREAKIEAALERVRSRTMAMHKSDELSETAVVLFKQLSELGNDPDRFSIGIIDEDANVMNVYATDQEGSQVNIRFKARMDEKTTIDRMYKGWKAKLKSDVIHLHGKSLEDWIKYLRDELGMAINVEHFKGQRFHNVAYFSQGWLNFTTVEPTSAETISLLERFAAVFNLTYRRFLDLQKAEANAREAQIEAGLERVRARTMAMHSSDDVGAATATMFTELEKLGIENFRGGITNIKTNRTQEVWSVNNLTEGKTVKAVGTFNIDDHSFWQNMYKEWEDKKEFLHYFLAGKEKEDYVKILSSLQNYLPQNIQQFPDVHFQVYFFGEGAVWTNSLQPHSEEAQQVMKRFTSVFSLTFRRYQDLKKAEAQAREAQIEAGLERVRARTMAMHSSDDVSTATATMFTELEKLGIESFRGGILNIRADQTMDVWSVNNLAEGKIVRAAGEFDMTMHPFWQQLYKGWVNKDEVLYFNMSGKDKEDYIRILDARRDYLPKGMQELPDSHIQSYYFGEGFVWTFTLQPHSEEDQQVMKKFASVFSLTFRRYQDLKKAEAQAREATIEAALEKVRGKAMAMHNSNDLTTTASLVFTELRKLGISPMRCGVGMLNKENRKALLYSAIASEEGDSLSQIGWVLLDVNPVLKSIYDHWISGEDYFPVLTKEMLKAYYEHLKSGFVVPEEQTEYEHHGYFLSFSEGVFYGWSEKPFTESEIKILKRFASVIDLTFRRYMELQKSEANAREAVKQAALDRVRAEIASMRTVSDLERITPLIWNELNILGIPFIRCGVFIMDEEQQLIHTFLSTPDGKAIAAFHIPYDTPGNIQYVLSNWHDKKRYLDHWDETAFTEFAKTLVKQVGLASPEQYLKTIPKGGFYLHFLPFLQGMLYVGNTTQLKEEEIELIQHVADAFSTAYARYEDFNKLEAAKQQVENTLTDLKQAQTQLVQAEKMASLGELTAGIAHEIQNPLNFVNNFSEVSKELLDEMKTELDSGNTIDAKDIADDVIQNLEKINHHGKRADAIVKSMLQHSRSSSGKKEPTDINALTDEYLRLAYHGLRAKDKSFNAKFETEFDNSIGKINIISQDIGRVLVNLINNAFYAVSEKKKQEANGYEPTVTVFTKKIDDKIEIKVKDNGNGIPQKVLDKIFQPFFTTKPTGQGTGLGLSLSYDIVTKGHGGELKVETKEKEGTIFIVQLPL